MDHTKSVEKTDQKMNNTYYSRNKIGKRNDTVDKITHHYDNQAYYPRKGKSSLSSSDDVKSVY